MNKVWSCALLLVCSVGIGRSALGKPKKHPHTQAAPAAAPATTPPSETSSLPQVAPGEAPETPPPVAPAPPATPQPPPEKPKAVNADLEALNTEYQAIRDELFKSRAKVEMLGAALFKTRMVALFEYKAQRAWPLKKVTLRLDDQPVYSADAPQAEEPIEIFDAAAAPGRHTLSVRVECGATGSSRLGYSTENSFDLDVADGKQARIELMVDETGDGPQPLATKKAGSFNLRVRAKVRSLELGAK